MSLRIGYLQFSPIRGDTDHNIRKIEKSIPDGSCDIVILPELCSTGYLFTDLCELASMAERIPEGNTTQRFIELSRRSGSWIIAGIAERANDQFYNSAICVSPEGFIGKYRKIHLFDREKLVFSSGNGGFPVFSRGNVRIGIMICFDWFFPESCRTLALKGADIIAHPANLVLPFCQNAMITRALENRVYTITSNRTGSEKISGVSLDFTGNSRIVSPDGRILVESDATSDELRIVDIDPELARNKSITPRNDLFSDRSPESYFC